VLELSSRSAVVQAPILSGQKIQWEPKKMEFAGGTGSSQWLTRDYRAPWAV